MQEKIINAGYLVEEIINIFDKKSEYSLSEEEKDKILFSLGFPESNTTLKISWGEKTK